MYRLSTWVYFFPLTREICNLPLRLLPHIGTYKRIARSTYPRSVCACVLIKEHQTKASHGPVGEVAWILYPLPLVVPLTFLLTI